MDAEHRHELKTNELADTLAHLPQLIKKNANTVIGVALIAAALITWPMFNKMSQQKETAQQSEMTQAIQLLNGDIANVMRAAPDDAMAKQDALDALLTNADNLLQKASKADNPNQAAMAQIKAAQAIRTELHLRQEVDAETLETQIQKAKDAYQQAFETAQAPTLKAMAQLGLGLCSEELGQTAQAAEIYTEIVDDESYKATVGAVQAQQRLDGLADNSETFVFAEVPVAIENLPAEIIDSATAITPQETTEAAAEPATGETPTDEALTTAAETTEDAEEETPAAAE
ncbi:MAG: tetratricopeptide repeat protein [Planctomycetota bacterium]|jgi:tetratricopeptide (TPR) repeat protein